MDTRVLRTAGGGSHADAEFLVVHMHIDVQARTADYGGV
jgi:hypothetical protein